MTIAQTTNYEKLAEISEELRDRLPDLLDAFAVEDYIVYEHRISMPCPVHDGDRHDGMQIFYGGRANVVNWKCYTHNCQSDFSANIFGLIQALLSKETDEEVKMGTAIKWCEDFLGKDFNTAYDEHYKDKIDFSRLNKKFSSKRKSKSVLIERKKVRSSLEIPATYFINRGFEPDVLNKYDVGYCRNPKASMYNRTVVPVYNDDYSYCIGCAGRSLYGQCSSCKLYHPTGMDCPTDRLGRYIWTKWKNSKGFDAESYFYNYWFAQRFIEETGKAIIVEGPPDVWKVVSAGFYNVLGMFGTALTEDRRILLEKSGATDIILFLDPDEAGQKSAKEIQENIEHMYNTSSIVAESDPGDLELDRIYDLLK